MSAEKKLRSISSIGFNFRVALITSAQLLALNATPVVIVPAPKTGFFNLLYGLNLNKPAGTAYAGIAAGEDLAVKYTDTNGLQVASLETTGFLDQTTAQSRWTFAYNAASGASDIAVVSNAPLVLQMLTGEITTGNSPLRLRIFYGVMRVLG